VNEPRLRQRANDYAFATSPLAWKCDETNSVGVILFADLNHVQKWERGLKFNLSASRFTKSPANSRARPASSARSATAAASSLIGRALPIAVDRKNEIQIRICPQASTEIVRNDSLPIHKETFNGFRIGVYLNTNKRCKCGISHI